MAFFTLPQPFQYCILIVDDSVSVVKYLEGIINKKISGNFIITTAFSAEEAFEKSELHSPDIIFLDLNLPRISGLEVCKKFRKKYPDVPIIIITAELAEELKAKAFAAGASDYVTKPFNSDQILNHMTYYLKKMKIRQLT